MNKQRKFYCTDKELKRLQQKALEHYQGKGFLSKYLRKIANSNSILIIEGKGNLKIKI